MRIAIPICLIIITLLSIAKEYSSEEISTFSDCEQCPVKNDSTDVFAFAAQVTAFIAKNADTGFLPNDICDAYNGGQISELQLQEYLEIFEKNKGTASCGLAAALTMRILLDNGIDAYGYSFGFPEISLSHMVVIVKVDKKLYLFDPFINYMIADGDGDPLPLDEFFNNVLDTAYRYDYASKPVFGDLTVDFSLIDTVSIMQNQGRACQVWSKGFTLLQGNIYQIKIRRSFQDELDRPCDSFITRLEKYLKKNTTLNTFGQAMLLKNGPIVGAADHAEVDSMLNSIILAQSKRWQYRATVSTTTIVN